MLTKDELRGRSELELARMLTETVEELGRIRRAHGNSLANLDPQTGGTVRRLIGESNLIGEAIDEQRGARGADAVYAGLNELVHGIPEEGKHPGHQRPGDSGSTGREIPRGGSLYGALQAAGLTFKPGERIRVGPGPLYAAVTVTNPVDTLSPGRLAGSIGLGADQRYIYPALKSNLLGALETGVDYL